MKITLILSLIFHFVHFYTFLSQTQLKKLLASKSAMNQHTIIFFTGIVNKLSQLFSQLNYLYLNAMLPKPQQNDEDQKKVDQIAAEQEKQEIQHAKNSQTAINEGQKDQAQPKTALQQQKVKADEKCIEFAIPKTPLSSFMIFYNEHRQQIKKSFPQCNSKEIKSLACNVWKDLSKQEKQVYYKKHKQQSIKYSKDLQRFRQNMQKMPNNKRQLLSEKIRKKKQLKEIKDRKNKSQLNEEKSKQITSKN